ncbi:class I SAM-dependent methyltransferase [Reinekea blandensis]|uniref:Ribosomal RNA small subunit methyltransferase J n=1 Tax=Reinekea blandensis MED297 TaxID=314283 RepID=A4BC08_9GAMM|nr:class I SAM-dependent methyltransferase [Reinekea blandensis]EAR10493.1 hypothetical protein MED297_01690 [Reinekea sp. MED297] [Reinekea blandensis MED297]
MNYPLYCPNPNDPANENLIRRLSDVPWIQTISHPADQPFLIINDGCLGIASADWPKVHPVVVDFLSGAASFRREHGGGTGQLVAKAVGLKKRRDLSVWDATAGLGRDAYVLASLGANVCLFERHPVVQALLQDGLYRLSLSAEPALMEIYDRMTLVTEGMPSSANDVSVPPEVIYLDPMFPERSKSAKVKKEMALFHDLVGTDPDADDLLEPALDLAEYRVVVKRPKGAPELAGRKPSLSLAGKSSRFDIYTRKAIPDAHT